MPPPDPARIARQPHTTGSSNLDICSEAPPNHLSCGRIIESRTPDAYDCCTSDKRKGTARVFLFTCLFSVFFSSMFAYLAVVDVVVLNHIDNKAGVCGTIKCLLCEVLPFCAVILTVVVGLLGTIIQGLTGALTRLSRCHLLIISYLSATAVLFIMYLIYLLKNL